MTQPRLYEVTLSSGTIHLLAPDSEAAAWIALELSQERDDELLNVRQADEWQEVLPKQLARIQRRT
jgi:hypothetical protein